MSDEIVQYDTGWEALRENRTPNQNLACFVLYLKITNTVLKNNVHLTVNCPRN